MHKIRLFYNENINGILATLIFHLIVFSILLISNLKVENIYSEPELIIDFAMLPPEVIKPTINKEPVQKVKKETAGDVTQSKSQTNIASNKLALKKDNFFDDNYLKEVENAKKLSEKVSQQLSKEIPVIKDLSMPVEDRTGVSTDSIKDRNYAGDSNISYFLEKRYHLKLPIPVYLTQNGGKVEVMIEVDRNGRVVKAEPRMISGINDNHILSYAKTAALRTVFNSSIDAPEIQKGKMIYLFVAQ